MRLTVAEKREVIRLVEGADRSVRQTLQELEVNRATFYAWYRRYQADGEAGLAAKPRAGMGIGFRRRCGSRSWTPRWRIRSARPASWPGSSPIAPDISSRNPVSIVFSRPTT